MKIFICPIPKRYLPDHQDFVWPPRNRESGWDFGVEQDFGRWILGHPELLTSDPVAADWGAFLPYWNRLYINNLDADNHWGGGLEFRSDLAATLDVAKKAHNGLRLFTVCEYDLAVLSPYLDLNGVTVFCASRRPRVLADSGIDIPLLSAPHPVCGQGIEKRWLAYFAGHLETDGIRLRMREVLQEHVRPDVYCEHEQSWCDNFRDQLCASYLALAPRGQGVQSFRFYEAMQLGTVPLYLSDVDARPFQKWIDWDECSFWLKPDADLSPRALPTLLDELAEDKPLLLEMGRRAKTTFDGHLAYGKWCPYVLRELERL